MGSEKGKKRQLELFHRFGSALVIVCVLVTIVAGLVGGVKPETIVLRAALVHAGLLLTLWLLRKTWVAWDETRQPLTRRPARK